MTADQQLSPVGRVLAALAFVAAGVFPILAAFDVGPLRSEDINGPPWIAVAAGGAFLAAGVAIAVGQSAGGRWLATLAGTLIMIFLAAIANWIAFGAGPRGCTSSVAGFFLASSRAAGDLECRIAFGIGAAMVDGALLWAFGAALAKWHGPGPVQGAIQGLGKGLVVLALLPFLLLLVVVGSSQSLVQSWREYRATGTWPRNESFIARMKAKRNLPP